MVCMFFYFLVFILFNFYHMGLKIVFSTYSFFFFPFVKFFCLVINIDNYACKFFLWINKNNKNSSNIYFFYCYYIIIFPFFMVCMFFFLLVFILFHF